jgi:RNA polymerase sigma factor for flagellar operon FliA
MDWAPRQKRRKAKQIEAAIAAAEQKLQRAPIEEEIAAQLNLSVDQYRGWLVEIRGLNFGNVEYASGDNGRDLLQYVADRDDQLPSRLLERAELEKLLAEAIARMPAIERTVLSLYYKEELTLREIAQIVDLHESRISQLKSQAILRIRTHVEKRWPTPRGLEA